MAVRLPFASWTEFGEFVVFLSVCVAGVANASRLWIVIGAMTLLLLGWPRYRELFAKAAKVDADYRELGWLVRMLRIGSGVDSFAKAHLLPLVLAVKLGQDCFFLAGAVRRLPRRIQLKPCLRATLFATLPAH